MYYKTLAVELLKSRSDTLYVPALKQLSSMMSGELFILNYLYTHNSQGHPGIISKSMTVSTARIAVLMNHLEEKEFITRQADPK